MIKNKSDYKEYLHEDAKALDVVNKSFMDRCFDIIYRFEKCLRKNEYYHNCHSQWQYKPIRMMISYRYRILSIKCGFTIPLNACGKGLSLAHRGTIVINGSAHIGDYCRIHTGVNIGTQAGYSDKAPCIGNRVYIGPGVKIFGDITIADDIAIGANAVVNKSFYEKSITIAGVPAKKISDHGSTGYLFSNS